MADPNQPPPQIDRKKLIGATPITSIICMVNYEKEKRKWLGVVCQAWRYADGTEGIMVYDVESADTRKAVKAWGRKTIAEKPWEATDGVVGSHVH